MALNLDTIGPVWSARNLTFYLKDTMTMTQENIGISPVDALQARIGQLEQEKIELETLLERSKTRDAKGNFLHLLSHELRTPLTSVNGALELLKEAEVGPLNQFQIDFLRVATNNTQRMINLIETLFDIARYENGLLKIERQAVNLNSLVENILNAGLRASFEAKKINFSADILSGLLVEADARRLYQVLEHLLSNACKFTPTGGNVFLKASVKGGKIEITVRDSGPGVSAQTLACLSARTFRVEEFLSRERNCSGLGLTITNCLLSLHRTRLRVENLAKGGASFSFDLPAATQTAF